MVQLLNNLIYFYEMYVDFSQPGSELSDMDDLRKKVLNITVRILEQSDIKPSDYIKQHSHSNVTAQLMKDIEKLEEKNKNA